MTNCMDDLMPQLYKNYMFKARAGMHKQCAIGYYLSQLEAVMFDISVPIV